MKIFLMLLNFIIVIFPCFAEDKIIKYPNNIDVRKYYISCDLTLTSVRCGNYITPSYEVKLTKKENVIIKELEVKINYYYGQDFDFVNGYLFILDEKEIYALNQKGEIILKWVLPEMKRESLEINKNALGYVGPDGEYIESIFMKLRWGT